MLLYHGSSVAVESPRLLTVQRELDFGKGFYVTSDMDQAVRWARRTALRRRHKDAVVSVYDVNETQMDALTTLRFTKPDIDWLRFVDSNRTGDVMRDEWDIVIGPVADDQTAPVISLFLDGMYDEEETIKRLLPQKLKDQYTFKTYRALSLLECVEVRIL